ncbi:DUF6415 family natural product biosynthesis protein [Streptomyces sp. NPDC003710]
MSQRTAQLSTTQGRDHRPLDLATMRQAVNRLLDPDAVPETLPPTVAELETLILQLRGHLQLLMPELERLARRLPRRGAWRYDVLACVGDARLRLTRQTEPDVTHARHLARALNALLIHHGNLSEAGHVSR